VFEPKERRSLSDVCADRHGVTECNYLGSTCNHLSSYVHQHNPLCSTDLPSLGCWFDSNTVQRSGANRRWRAGSIDVPLRDRHATAETKGAACHFNSRCSLL